MKIIATPIKAKDLLPGDLFSAAPQSYWDTVALLERSVGEKVYIRTEAPISKCTNICSRCASDQDADTYKITIQH